MDKISSGIAEFDYILDGGFPSGASVLIVGRPGSGKTILAHQIMFHNARQDNKVIYLTTLAEPQVKVMRFQKEFTYFDTTKFQKSVIYYDLGGILRKLGPARVLLTIDELLKKYEPGMMIIDTIKIFADIIPGMTEFREFILDLSLRLATWGCTTLLLCEYSEEDIEIRPESAIADGIICLYGNEEKHFQKRFMRILKMRGTNHVSGETVFKITSNGIEVFPRLNPVVNAQFYSQINQRVSTGVPGLDALMGGGILRGTTTLLSGSAGIGKTFLCLSFATAGFTQKEKTVFVSFEESPAQLIHDFLNLGINLEQYISAGLLQIMHVSPIELDVDEHVYRIQKLVRDMQAERLVIDSISAFEIGMSNKVKYTDYVWALTDFFKTQGVSVLLTHEMHNSGSTSSLTKHGISYVADNLVMLHYQEEVYGMKRLVRVLKMRSSSHSTELGEMIIDQYGVSIVPMTQAIFS